MFPSYSSPFRPALSCAAITTAGLLAATPAAALNVRLVPYSVPAADDKPEISVALFYPTRAATRESFVILETMAAISA